MIDPNEFDWQDRNRPVIPWSQTVIYEAHVKGFSQLNPAVPPEMRGTYDGMSNKATVEYIKSLGVTSVELLPVHWFPDDQHLLDKGLKNFWGYNSLSFLPRPRATLARVAFRASVIWSAPSTMPVSR